MTGGKKCAICKLVALLAGIGALNWGLTAFFNLNLVARLLGGIPKASKIAYGLIGLSGLMLLVSLFMCCPCQKGSCGTKT